MPIGPGEQDVRRLQSTGGSTFTLSLPKPWVLQHKLNSRDVLKIDWRPSGALRITPFDAVDKAEKSVFLSMNQLPENSLFDHLMGAYISGADLIEIEMIDNQSRQSNLQVRRFLRNTRGFEIFEETDDSLVLKCLLNPGDMPIHASLNRMYLLLTSLVRDLLSVFEGEDKEFIQDAADRENEVDALLYLIERQVRISLDSHKVASSLNLSRTQALEFANLARSLERMMDHAYTLSELVKENPNLTTNMIDMAPLEQLPKWQLALKELMINIRTRDSTRIEIARGELKECQQVLKRHEKDLLDNHRHNEWMAFDLSLSESVRRLCAYARDFGEILLNMLVFSKIITQEKV
ncbi:MAG: phosphate uptake regulator PhoU [Candidatus Poseidoniaceae archaeon]|jgi:phosphate uptake regulator|nr:phosphate uptake regulator PhoU [Candidatus Poseidoniaceae archaeon]